jgi:hypothetical protein
MLEIFALNAYLVSELLDNLAAELRQFLAELSPETAHHAAHHFFDSSKLSFFHVASPPPEAPDPWGRTKPIKIKSISPPFAAPSQNAKNAEKNFFLNADKIGWTQMKALKPNLRITPQNPETLVQKAPPGFAGG